MNNRGRIGPPWLPWAITGVSVVLTLLLLLLPRGGRGADAVQEPAVQAPAEVPPDLATMTPRERFDRLYNRIMRSAESGDLAQARQFAPMAFSAYGQLDSVDADARYHAAVLYLHISDDAAAALRLADSISAVIPRHLFATLIRGTVARQGNDASALRRAETAFLADWEGEMALGRPEYADHRTMLDEFRARARRDLGKPE